MSAPDDAKADRGSGPGSSDDSGWADALNDALKALRTRTELAGLQPARQSHLELAAGEDPPAGDAPADRQVPRLALERLRERRLPADSPADSPAESSPYPIAGNVQVLATPVARLADPGSQASGKPALVPVEPKAAARPAPAPTPHPPPKQLLWAPRVAALGGVGLVSIALAILRARHDAPPALTELLWWTGLLLIFAPTVLCVLASRVSDRDKVLTAVTMPIILQLSRIVVSPPGFVAHDELIHSNGLRLIEQTHHLFAVNSLLPVTEYYPGLELVADAVAALTGTSQHVGAVLTLILARVVLASALVGLVRTITGSARAAGIAAVLYSCNPQAVGFNSQFSYETLALPLAVAALYLAASRAPAQAAWRAAVLPILVLIGVGLTHHLTSMLLVAAFAGWLVIDLLLPAGERGRRRQAPMLALITLVGATFVTVWSVLPGNPLLGYLGDILSSSTHDISLLLHGTQTHRLFHDSSGEGTPLWEQAASLLSIFLVMLMLPFALWDGRRWLRSRVAIAVLLALTAAVYPLIPAGHLTSATAEVTDRGAGFIFIGLAFLVAGWLAIGQGLGGVQPRLLLPLLVTGGCVLFVGGDISGSGSTASQLPGPFEVSADARSIDGANLGAAHWLQQNLPPDQRVFADRDSGLLAAAIGGQHTVTHIGDGIDASRLLLEVGFSATDRQLIEQARISYVIVDRRDSSGLPHEQFYIESGEYGSTPARTAPVPAAALAKLVGVPGVDRVFDNGALAVYDTRGLLG